MAVARILVALELSDADAPLLELAREYAGAFGASLHLVHVAPPDPDFVGLPKDAEGRPDGEPEAAVGYAYDRNLKARRLREAHEALQAAAERLEADGTAASALLLEGPAGARIEEEVERLGIDLVVIGARQRNVLVEWLVGSTSKDVVRAATCPVLLVPVPT